MNGFDAYQLYIALRNHFTTDKYDFFKFNGKVKASASAYEGRKDVYQFRRLGALPDPKGRIVASMINDITFINDILAPKGAAAERDSRKIIEGGSYAFKSFLPALTSDIETLLIPHDNRYPDLLQSYIAGKTPIQYVIAIDGVLDCIKRWDVKLKDDLLWPEVRIKLVKYKPFYDFDKRKFREIIVDYFINNA